nr:MULTISPECIES: Ig-like domain-containing protein [Pseudomonas]
MQAMSYRKIQHKCVSMVGSLIFKTAAAVLAMALPGLAIATGSLTSSTNVTAHPGQVVTLKGVYAKKTAGCLKVVGGLYDPAGLLRLQFPDLTQGPVNRPANYDNNVPYLKILDLATPCAALTEWEAEFKVPYDAYPGTTKTVPIVFNEYNASFAELITNTSNSLTLTIPAAYSIPPEAIGKTETASYGTTKAIALSYMPASANATAYKIKSLPEKGTVFISGGTANYTPAPGFYGADKFTYSAVNAFGESTPADVYVTVTPPSLDNSYHHISFTGKDFGKTVINGSIDESVEMIHSLTSPWGAACTSGAIVAWNEPYLDIGYAVSINGGAYQAGSFYVGGCSYLRDHTSLIQLSSVATYNFTTGVSVPGLKIGDVMQIRPYKKAWRSANFGGNGGGTIYELMSPQVLTINIVPKKPRNSVPVLSNGVINGVEDQIGSTSVVVTDADVGDTHSFSLTAPLSPTIGTVSFIGKTMSFTPAPDWSGSAVIKFKATDSKSAESNEASVTVTYTPVNDAPTAVTKTISTDEDTAGSVALAVVDPDIPYDDTHSYEIVVAPDKGTAVITGSSLTYTPSANWNGSTSLTYRVRDSAGVWSAPALVTINVAPVNDSPIAQTKAFSTPEDTAGTVTLSGTDIDSPTPSTFQIVTAPNAAHGTATISGSTLTFTPSANWNGSTSLTYRAQDSSGAWSVPVTVSITVTPVNDLPEVSNRTISTDEDITATLTLTVSDVDLSFEGDSHTWEIVTAPNAAHGSASISGSTLTFTPVANWNGMTTLTYRAKDSKGAYSAPMTVTITVISVNDVPVAADFDLTTPEETAITISRPGTDIEDNDSLQLVVSGSVTNGTLKINGPNVEFTPALDYNGTSVIKFKVIDTEGAWSNEGTITINVTAVNDVPTHTGATISANEGQPSEPTAPWVTDVDTPYGDLHTFSIESQPANGTVALVDGKLIYTPAAQFHGEDTFTIRATDGEGESVVGTALVTVNKFNFAPTDIIPGDISFYEGIGVTTVITVVDPNNWGSHNLDVVTQPGHGDVTISGNELTFKTDGSTETAVKLRATDQDGQATEKTIALKVRPASEFFDGRQVIETGVTSAFPAVRKQMKTTQGNFALQFTDEPVISALGKDLAAYVTPDSEVGVSLESRELAQSQGMRLVPSVHSETVIEAAIGGLDVGVDGEATILLSRSDRVGPVYSVKAHAWAVEGGLEADNWTIKQAAGRTKVNFSPTNSACSIKTGESAARQSNTLTDPTCWIQWTQTPDEWRNLSDSTTLRLEGSARSVGQQPVKATVYVFDEEGGRHELVSFTRDLNVEPLAGQLTFGLQPAPAEAYQGVENLSLLVKHTGGPACELTVNPTKAKNASNQWQNKSVCLIQWTHLPGGLTQAGNWDYPQTTGGIDTLGEQTINWEASIFTPSGEQVSIGHGAHTINVVEPPLITVDLPTTNQIGDKLYAVSSEGGFVGNATVVGLSSDIRVRVEVDGVETENQVVPSYGRTQRINRQIHGKKASLWSQTPYEIEASYTKLPSHKTAEVVELLAVPDAAILPMILNDERSMLDTELLPVEVAIKNTRYPEDPYSLASMGDWDVRLYSILPNGTRELMSDWEPVDGSGIARFDLGVGSLTNQAIRLYAEARVRSPVPEYESIRSSPSPLIISILNGDPLLGHVQALRVIGPAPLRSTFYAMTDSRLEARDLGGVRWEMSVDEGATWQTIDNTGKMPQRLTKVFEKGRYLLRAEMTNRNSGAKSLTPEIEVIAFLIPQARIKGPANVFINDTGNFTLTNVDGTALDTTNLVIEWSEDRGKTWAAGSETYQLTRDKSVRVYLQARLKYADSPDDKRVYKNLRAGVAFRPVRPPRVQIIGPRRPEVGAEATWTANMMMPYPKMDLTMDGFFILPDGTETNLKEVKYTPTTEDFLDEGRTIGFKAWINGYEDKGGMGLTEYRLIFWSYDWPEWQFVNKMTAGYAPADLTMQVRSMGTFREFEGLQMEWEIPPYDEVAIIKDDYEPTRILKINEPGNFQFGVHITDSRGNYSFIEQELEFLEPLPWLVQLSWSGDNEFNRAPLGVLLRPSISGGHPKDRIETRTYSMNGDSLPSSGDYGRATLNAGLHTARLDITTSMGYSAFGAVDIGVEQNQPPSCAINVIEGSSSWLAKATCTDQDGRIDRHLWFVDGVQQGLGSSSISVPKWRYPNGLPIITVVGVDNSGAESQPVANQ